MTDDHKSDCATHNDPYLPKGECDCGADTRRQAAEEWVRSMGYRAMAEPAPPEIEEAHIAGQELGEQRAVEGIVRWLREGMLGHVGIAFPTSGDMIERGEWKEGK